MPVTDWLCPKCGVANPRTYFKCQTCQQPKPIFWQCPKCHRRNPTASEQCAGCKASTRPAPLSTVQIEPNQVKFNSDVTSTADLTGATSSALMGAMSQATSSNLMPAGSSAIPMSSTVASARSTFQQQSSYDIFRRLSRPSKTVRRINYVDNDDRYRQIVTLCETRNTPYIDRNFPPSSKSLYYNSENYQRELAANRTARIYWLRYKDMRPPDAASGQLMWTVMRDPLASDINQGLLGNCWFLSALAVIVERPTLLDRILPTKELSPVGVYRVRLYKDGKMTSVIIDDLFPCNGRRLLIYSCAKRKQLFVPIVEKAMAKLYGCYESLVSGQTTEGLSALTGFPCRSIKIQVTQDVQDETALDPDLIWGLLLSYYTAGFLMGAACSCSATGANQISEEEYRERGLLMRHAYSIISVTTINDELRLVRLRNPWGQLVWTGDWSDQSPLWSPELQEVLQPYYGSDGIFWMSFTDFQRYFEKVDVCKLRDGWHEFRQEGYFPLSCIDTSFLSVFVVKVEENGTELEFTLYQESRRSVVLHSTLQQPICAALFQFKENHNNCTCGDLIDFSGYKMREFVGLDCLVDKGVYLVAIYAFNHWSQHSKPTPKTTPAQPTAKPAGQSGQKQAPAPVQRQLRPRYVLSLHSSRYVTLNALQPTSTILGDTLIELTIGKGRQKMHNENVVSYYLHDNWAGLMVVVENRNKDTYVDVILDANESTNLLTTRGNLHTRDTIPPLSRQLVNILSHHDSASPYYLSYQMSYRVISAQGTAATHSPDIRLLQALHSPRPLKQMGQ